MWSYNPSSEKVADLVTPGKKARSALSGPYEFVKGISIARDQQLITIGRPQNPVGRTGIAGRGLLPKWGASMVSTRVTDMCPGPNKSVCQIATRWKLNPSGLPVERKGRRVLEVVAVLNQNGEWCLPMALDGSPSQYLKCYADD